MVSHNRLLLAELHVDRRARRSALGLVRVGRVVRDQIGSRALQRTGRGRGRNSRSRIRGVAGIVVLERARVDFVRRGAPTARGGQVRAIRCRAVRVLVGQIGRHSQGCALGADTGATCAATHIARLIGLA